MSKENQIGNFYDWLSEVSEDEPMQRAKSEAQPLPTYLRHYTNVSGRKGIIDSLSIRESESGTFGQGVYLTDVFTPATVGNNLQWIANALQIPPVDENGMHSIEKCFAFIDAKVDVNIPIEQRMRREVPFVEYIIPTNKLVEGVWRLDSVSYLSGEFAEEHR